MTRGNSREIWTAVTDQAGWQYEADLQQDGSLLGRHLSVQGFTEPRETGAGMALKKLCWRSSLLASRTPLEVQWLLVDLSVELPAYGWMRIANDPRKGGYLLLSTFVRSVGQLHDLESMNHQGRALDARAGQNDMVPSESQLVPGISSSARVDGRNCLERRFERIYSYVVHDIADVLSGRRRSSPLTRFKRVALRCEKTKRNFGSFVALAAACILVKSVQVA